MGGASWDKCRGHGVSKLKRKGRRHEHPSKRLEVRPSVVNYVRCAYLVCRIGCVAGMAAPRHNGVIVEV